VKLTFPEWSVYQQAYKLPFVAAALRNAQVPLRILQGCAEMSRAVSVCARTHFNIPACQLSY
jgi:hypothetical protein